MKIRWNRKNKKAKTPKSTVKEEPRKEEPIKSAPPQSSQKSGKAKMTSSANVPAPPDPPMSPRPQNSQLIPAGKQEKKTAEPVPPSPAATAGNSLVCCAIHAVNNQQNCHHTRSNSSYEDAVDIYDTVLPALLKTTSSISPSTFIRTLRFMICLTTLLYYRLLGILIFVVLFGSEIMGNNGRRPSRRPPSN